MALTSTHDGQGNVILYGGTATHDGAGHVVLTVAASEEGAIIAEDEVSLSLVDTSGYATHSEVEQTAESISLTVARGVVGDLEIGGRNLIVRATSTPDQYIDANGNAVTNAQYAIAMTDYIPIVAGQQYTLSREDGLGDYFRIAWYGADDESKTFMGGLALTKENTGSAMDSNKAGAYVWTAPDGAEFLLVSYPWAEESRAKMEKGSKATDWTPAPEDVEGHTNSKAEEAMSQIQQLADKLSMLVVDENGKTLWEQTSEGWTFNMADVVSGMDANAADIAAAAEELEKLAAYVRIKAEGGTPLLELGDESAFKTQVTNTEMRFMNGDEKMAYLNNEALNIKNAAIESKLKIGGFSWYRRDNGNVGIVWEGEGE